LPLTSGKRITSLRSRNQRYAAKNRAGRSPAGDIREQIAEELIGEDRNRVLKSTYSEAHGVIKN
jgi:hypothetical protein